MTGTIGKWAFIIGLILAVLAGLFFDAAWVFWVLAVFGVVVGLFNVTTAETQNFLLASIALTISASALNGIPLVGGIIANILAYVVAFVAGGMIVVALLTLFRTAKT
jgi:zinc transporter ZupT